jgi:hypothetical protein
MTPSKSYEHLRLLVESEKIWKTLSASERHQTLDLVGLLLLEIRGLSPYSEPEVCLSQAQKKEDIHAR